MKINLLNFFKGFFIGIGNIIPGVSGGTLAVSFDLFDKIISAINNLTVNFRKNFLFLLPIGLGAGAGILIFSSIVNWALIHYPFPTNMFFIGLVSGSVPLIYKKSGVSDIKASHVCVTLIFFLTTVYISSLTLNDSLSNNMTRASVAMSIKLFVGGIISAASMVIPGISGSFMLVILGLYNLVLNTVSSISSIVVKPSYDLIIHLISVLVPFCIGSLVGVLSISKIIEYILKKIQSYTYFAILGLMLGSIFSIFKDPATYAAHGSIGFIPSITAFILFAIGLLISLKTTNTE